MSYSGKPKGIFKHRVILEVAFTHPLGEKEATLATMRLLRPREANFYFNQIWAGNPIRLKKYRVKQFSRVLMTERAKKPPRKRMRKRA